MGTIPLRLRCPASTHLSGFLHDLLQEDEEVARVPADQLLQAPAVQTQASWKGRERREFSLGLESSGNPRGHCTGARLAKSEKTLDRQSTLSRLSETSVFVLQETQRPAGIPFIGHDSAALAPGKLPFFHSLPCPGFLQGVLESARGREGGQKQRVLEQGEEEPRQAPPPEVRASL